MIGVRLSSDIEKRLDALAKATGRTKSYYVREALLEHLDDMEDAYLAEATLERVRRGDERVLGSEEFWRDLEG
ncbi:ribbon-helix-helix protein, CopG family [Acidithiobacillus sp. ATCC 19703]|uniref:Relaxosome protein TraY n=1 Tax=Acidithiobacillus concretivorus TaxID=3063952 RepID=A0ABS5ZSW9_9PROT|nr:ribbon-helix-helix protein, CopG family [Acidithiobacillus concretivorus]